MTMKCLPSETTDSVRLDSRPTSTKLVAVSTGPSTPPATSSTTTYHNDARAGGTTPASPNSSGTTHCRRSRGRSIHSAGSVRKSVASGMVISRSCDAAKSLLSLCIVSHPSAPANAAQHTATVPCQWTTSIRILPRTALAASAPARLTLSTATANENRASSMPIHEATMSTRVGSSVMTMSTAIGCSVASPTFPSPIEIATQTPMTVMGTLLVYHTDVSGHWGGVKKSRTFSTLHSRSHSRRGGDAAAA
mmetsp:Transcript_44070/g.109859  ORF Transcript_44070/g.109859 Transcript_44070/m.109859 type:complete len:249 (-) Transcript_44070:638-1384(-)